jgi:uncharacterized membrane protein
MEGHKLATGLGWFSLGLGLYEVIAPRHLGRVLGMEDRAGLLRLYGLREIANGIGLLSQQKGPGKPAPWVWGRVAGDALDLATLSMGLARDNPKRDNVVAAIAAVAGVTLVDILCAERLSEQQRERQEAAGRSTDPGRVERSLTIGRSADELYRVWRDPQTLPRLMADFADVTILDDTRAHWRVPTSLGRSLEWDAQTVEEQPGTLVRWQSVAGMAGEGGVRFRPAPGDRGTEVTLHLHFDPPGGALGEGIARVFRGLPKVAAAKALRRFKSLAETGEIPTTRPQPAARDDKD